MLILTELEFKRSKWETNFPNVDITGKATFCVYEPQNKSVESVIHIPLSKEQTDRILMICQESIRDTVDEGLKSVRLNLLQGGNAPALEHKDV